MGVGGGGSFPVQHKLDVISFLFSCSPTQSVIFFSEWETLEGRAVVWVELVEPGCWRFIEDTQRSEYSLVLSLVLSDFTRLFNLKHEKSRALDRDLLYLVRWYCGSVTVVMVRVNLLVFRFKMLIRSLCNFLHIFWTRLPESRKIKSSFRRFRFFLWELEEGFGFG